MGSLPTQAETKYAVEGSTNSNRGDKPLAKITIADVSGGYNLQQDVNARFQQVEDALNTNVLWRTAVMGESNNMDHDLDADSNDLLNVNSIDATNILSGGIDIIAQVDAAELAATQQASSAADSAIAAAASAVTANNGVATIGASEAAAAQSAIDSEASNQSAINAYNQSIIQVGLAEDEVAKCVVQVGLAADEVQLANDQVQLAGAQATIATGAAGTASADAVIAANGAFQVGEAETRINNAIAVLDMTGIIGPGDDDAVSNANLQIELAALEPLVTVNNNELMNSDFEVDQRDGEITTLDGVTPQGYIADRWLMARGGTSGSITPQLRDDSSVVNLLSGRKNCKIIEMDYTSLNATNGVAGLIQRIENVKTLLRSRSDAPAKNLTVSFLANGAETNQKVLVLINANHGTGGSAPTTIEATPVDIDGTWTQYEVTIPLTDLGTTTVTDDSYWALEFYTYAGTDFFGGSINANPTAVVQLANIKAEIGDVATPLITLPFGENLAQCERYYQKSYNYEDGPQAVTAVGSYIYEGTGLITPVTQVTFGTRMYATPTISVYSPITGTLTTMRNDGIVSDISAIVYNPGQTGTGVYASGTPAAGDDLRFHWVAEAEI